METAKTKCKLGIEWYKKNHLTEYEAVKKIVSYKRDNLKVKYGDMTKETSAIERPLNEIPETLWNFLIVKMNAQEWDWFKGKEGQHWLGKTYSEFRITTKI